MALQSACCTLRKDRTRVLPLLLSLRSTYCLHHLPRRRRSPERLRAIVLGCRKISDRSLQLRHTHKATASDCQVRHFPEPALYQVRPTRTGGDEVANRAQMIPQPSLHKQLFMRSIVVHEQMEFVSGGKFPIHAAKDAYSFLMAMPGVPFTDGRSVQDVERRDKRRGVFAFPVARYRAAAFFVQRKPQLSAIKTSNPAPVIQAQHRRIFRWAQIQSHHIDQLLK